MTGLGAADVLLSAHGPTALRQLAQTFERLGREIDDRAEVVAEVARQHIGGADSCSLTAQRGESYITLSATDEIARRGDELQYEMNSGPCVSAIQDSTIYRPRDLSHDDRWPEFGTRAVNEVGVQSMLSFRLAFNKEDLRACLNVYSTKKAAFDEDANAVGLIIATHAAAVLMAHTNKTKADGLQRALESNREIGIAMGVLMARHQVTREQAFDLLRIASQNSNRKLADIATEVADTGALELPSPKTDSHRVRGRRR